MEQLKVIGTEDDVLVLATESGERFALTVDDTLRSYVRRPAREQEPRSVRANPREIQSHIRAGLSAEDVASLLEIRVEDVERFEGPVLAEREYIVGQALAVPVLLGTELDPAAQPTFGQAVRSKLSDASATDERWTSWKEPTGWIVKLEFTSHDVAHDARWVFDPRRSTLSPQNSDAVQLSRQGSLPDGLIPRLRALDNAPKDSSHFDAAVFGAHVEPEADIEAPAVPQQASSGVQDAAIKRAPERHEPPAETADLLEALRRRRGQREPMPTEATAPAHAPVALFDALEPGYEDTAPVDDADAPTEPEAPQAPAESSKRKGRPSMPSWDEIVFGARTEDA